MRKTLKNCFFIGLGMVMASAVAWLTPLGDLMFTPRWWAFQSVAFVVGLVVAAQIDGRRDRELARAAGK